VIDQNFVFTRDIQVFVALSTRIRQIDRMSPGNLHTRRQDIVVPVTVFALRHVLTVPDNRPPMGLVLFGRLGMACATAFTSHSKICVFAVRNSFLVDMAKQTVKSLM
jgi:hypothetical protein